MHSVNAYPARLDAHLDGDLRRWMWLIKWLLAIPHLLVLVVLWMGVTVTTVVAGFAILFTGRYPRSLFDFAVGVLRWTWRVEFYAFKALGTDRYPPFTLGEVPDYPATFSVDYPEHLSRGLVLVKWWLLAIPQYLIVAVFAGGWGGGSGLIALLAIVAGVILLVTGAYPRDLFSFVMGLNRWCYRVSTYALLPRDEYPPFRLDAGGADPGSSPVTPPPSLPQATPPLAAHPAY